MESLLPWFVTRRDNSNVSERNFLDLGIRGLEPRAYMTTYRWFGLVWLIITQWYGLRRGEFRRIAVAGIVVVTNAFIRLG